MALLGIIFIQYRWIDESLNEKKRLIHQKVHQLAANVDQRMSDFNSFAFLTSDSTMTSAFTREVIFGEEHFLDSLSYSDSSSAAVFISYMEKEGIDTIEAGNIEFKVIASDEGNIPPDTPPLFELSDTLMVEELDSSVMRIQELTNFIERIKIEVDASISDIRLDSVIFAQELIEEFENMGLVAPNAWGVYDDYENDYAIQPADELKWDYEIALFKNDLLHPDRYILYISMEDANAQIWKEIAVMISLSLIFIAIIIFVFIYAIRLVIKHKTISEIKSDFINNMTHEFKTPLASISLAADSILHPKVALDPAKVESYVNIIKAEKSKLNRHVETILEIASLKANDLPIEFSEVNLSESIKASIEKLDLLIQDSGCALNLQLDDQLVLNANGYHLENVLTNIIENGIKYSENQPQLSITTLKKGDKAIIEITDQGIGMTKEQVKKAFDNFYRAQKGNIHNTKGFGLGLSFVKYMVEKMHGAIWIKSQLHKGTTVTIEFPV